MKKIFLITCIVLSSFTNEIYLDASNKDKQEIKEYHKKVGLTCVSCHGIKAKEDKFEIVTTKKCMECHSDYQELAKRTGALGYDDNIHASPHYPDMDCTICHSGHKQSTNYCVMCHSQDSLKDIKVP